VGVQLGGILPWWRSPAPFPGGGGVELCLRAFVCGVVASAPYVPMLLLLK
jgi:hypothetical protein